ncbi:MAG: S8 family serine peptidase, partial [Flammeovirgaceae bacterium]
MQKNLLSDANVVSMRVHEKPHVEAAIDFSNLAYNRIAKAQQVFPTLTAANEKVSVKEEAFDETDVDLRGRSFKTALTPNTISQHATTMSKLIGGAGNSFYKAKGVATQVNLTASNFLNLLPDAAAVLNSNNILVQNHSYGVGIENYYGEEAVAYDQQVTSNPKLSHVFSSGNSGNTNAADGLYKGLPFANLTGNFKHAKNVVVVTAVDSNLSVNNANSRGPTFDGRLKPELTAYGQGGTSEGAALTSGTITLMQQLYKSKFGIAADASMVKAILIATADDIAAKGIDYATGYGS